MRSDRTDNLMMNGYATYRWSRIHPVPKMQCNDEGFAKYHHPPHFPRTVNEFWELGIGEDTKPLLQLLTFYRIYAYDELEDPFEEYVAYNREEAHSRLAHVLNLNYEEIRFHIAQESRKRPYQDPSTESAISETQEREKKTKVELPGNDLPQKVAPHRPASEYSLLKDEFPVASTPSTMDHVYWDSRPSPRSAIRPKVTSPSS